nr:hypothetical protein [Tanacetum cinerariifolium]
MPFKVWLGLFKIGTISNDTFLCSGSYILFGYCQVGCDDPVIQEVIVLAWQSDDDRYVALTEVADIDFVDGITCILFGTDDSFLRIGFMGRNYCCTVSVAHEVGCDDPVIREVIVLAWQSDDDRYVVLTEVADIDFVDGITCILFGTDDSFLRIGFMGCNYCCTVSVAHEREIDGWL